MSLRIALVLLLWFAAPLRAETEWVTSQEGGPPQVHLWFFWSTQCPHCQEARPVVERMAAQNPWLRLHSHEITRDPANARLYMDMARALGEEARSVPAFILCGEMVTGFHSEEVTGSWLLQRARACQMTGPAAAAPTTQPVVLPLLGAVDPAGFSLPAVTVLLAGMDAFNPCAFFVLLFLLSLLTHERSRARMLVVGGVFVLFSGLVYFALMAAWLNVFLIAGELRALTLGAGAVAVAMALINLKDYVWFKQGPSLSIPDSAKPRLFERMRRLIKAQSWPALLAGTVTLALAANSYELLCTAGFPMVYTRLLTLNPLSPAGYYGYLALYNFIYVLPLLLIVLAFVRTLGSRKLSEAEGRILKLVSGVMMLALGSALLLAPELLSNPAAAGLMVLAAIAVGAAAWWRERRRARMV